MVERGPFICPGCGDVDAAGAHGPDQSDGLSAMRAARINIGPSGDRRCGEADMVYATHALPALSIGTEHLEHPCG